jgi:hypothetical protein
VVQTQLQERDEFLAEIRGRLEQAQQHYKLFYDRHCRDMQFTVGDWVWLRLLHQLLASLNNTNRSKLGPKFYGPFQILERIGDVAYKLQLPQGAKLHDVFHVGLLKRYYGGPPTVPDALPAIRHGHACPMPESVLKVRLAKGRHELLVQWVGQAAANARWVDIEESRRHYPALHLEDELSLQRGGGGDVMVGQQYKCRAKTRQGVRQQERNIRDLQE